MKKLCRSSAALAAALALALAPAATALADSAKDAMVFTTAAMPGKFNKMPLGWFFYNLAMTEAYAEKADDLTMSASGRLFDIAADKESNDLLKAYDQDIAKQKGKKKKQKLDERNKFVEAKLDAVDTAKKLDEPQKKELALALLETAVALRMEQLVVKGGTAMVDNIGSVQSEAKASGNPLAAGKTAAKVAGASKTVPGTVTSAKNGIVRLEKISRLLVELGKTNKINPPSEKEAAAAEQNYVSEIKLED